VPRRGERRENVVVRMSGAVRSAVDERAAIENVKRSDYVRHAVEFALEAMPPGWRPRTGDGGRGGSA
jgi:hypothetical protein